MFTCYNYRMKRLLADSGWVLIGQVITSVTAFAGMSYLAWILPQETMGEYRYILSIVTILAISTLPGLDTALVRSTARGFDNQLGILTLYKMKWGSIGSAVGIVFAAYYALAGNMTLAGGFIIASALIPLYGSFFNYFFYIQGRQEFARAAIINAVTRILFLAILIAGVWVFPNSMGAIGVFMVAVIVSHMMGYWYVQRTTVRSDGLPDNEVTGYGKRLTWLGSWSIIAVNIDKVLVWFFLGPIPVAVYTIATLLPLESIRIGRIFSQVLLPRFSGDHQHYTSWAFIKRLLALELVLVMGWLLFAIIARPLFELFFPAYLESVPYAIIAMLIMLSAPVYIIRSYFTGQQSHHELNILLIGIPILKTVILTVGLWQYGLWGAIWAMVIGGCTEVIISIYLFQQSNQQSVRL